jgi:hypothetical protein
MKIRNCKIENYARLGYHKGNMKLQCNERGEFNILLIPVIFLTLLLIGAGVFGVWAWNGRQDYKNNVDQKIGVAVDSAKQQVQSSDAKQFAEAAKQPLKTYVGPEPYGSVHISYPKTWSAYVNASGNSSIPLDGFLYPDVVPSVTDVASAFALRVQVVQQAYSQVVSQFNSAVQQKKATVTPYKLPKVASVVGVRVDGQIAQNKQGSMVILPLRDKTLKIWTEADSFIADFNNNILPNVTFSP